MNTKHSENLPPPPPHGIAISGLIFSGLFITSLAIVRIAVPADPTEPGSWLAEPELRSLVHLAMNLVPFTGIAFLWFMAVLRSRLGGREDRFFATVFFGSGLLFVALLFVVAAISQALLDTFSTEGSQPARSDTYAVCRAITFALMNTFAVKMAAVFIFVTSSISIRTAVFPRWIAFVGYFLALVMLLTITEFAWIAIVFPAWVLLLSVYILATESFWPNRVVSSAAIKS